jgi:hypothetical protein
MALASVATVVVTFTQGEKGLKMIPLDLYHPHEQVCAYLLGYVEFSSRSARKRLLNC